MSFIDPSLRSLLIRFRTGNQRGLSKQRSGHPNRIGIERCQQMPNFPACLRTFSAANLPVQRCGREPLTSRPRNEREVFLRCCDQKSQFFKTPAAPPPVLLKLTAVHYAAFIVGAQASRSAWRHARRIRAAAGEEKENLPPRQQAPTYLKRMKIRVKDRGRR